MDIKRKIDNGEEAIEIAKDTDLYKTYCRYRKGFEEYAEHVRAKEGRTWTPMPRLSKGSMFTKISFHSFPRNITGWSHNTGLLYYPVIDHEVFYKKKGMGPTGRRFEGTRFLVSHAYDLDNEEDIKDQVSEMPGWNYYRHPTKCKRVLYGGAEAVSADAHLVIVYETGVDIQKFIESTRAYIF